MRAIITIAVLCLLGCSVAQNNSSQVATRTLADTANSRSKSTGDSNSVLLDKIKESQNLPEVLIWAGMSQHYNVRWTTRDLYVEPEIGRLWAPLVSRGYDDFLNLQAKFSRADNQCTYDRYLSLLSVVGSLISYKDEYSDYCGGAHGSESVRFTTVDISKTKRLAYATGNSTPLMDVDITDARTGIVNLSDYFTEGDLVNALLSDQVMRRAISSSQVTNHPKTLREILNQLSSEGYMLGDSGFELPSDYLTRFAFHHLEGDRVAIRISLRPASVANQSQHAELGLLLRIPDGLRSALNAAASKREGFLMKDSKQIAGGKFTCFKVGAK